MSKDLDTAPPDSDDEPEAETRTAEPRGESEPPPGRPIFPPPNAPYDVAKQLYEGCRDEDGIRNLLAYRGGWMIWKRTHWGEVDLPFVSSRIYNALQNADYVRMTKDGPELVPWLPTKYKIANILDAMAAIGHLLTKTEPPAWIDRHSLGSDAGQVISCKNGLLDLTTRSLHPHSPAMFNLVGVPFNYRPTAGRPRQWLDFLASLWDDDDASIALLQEYFGYVLSGRLDQQKLLAVIGPTRSGKGTIARALTDLIGKDNVAGPTMASLSTNFGLMPLIGKPLAIVADASLGDTAPEAVVERLLSITGEDSLTLDRKFKDHWTGRLPSRFVLLSNELPRFRDSSGVIANRFLVLKMTRSFLGREDRTLADRIRRELPAILNWSLEGLDRLNAHGRFTIPQSSDDIIRLMQDLASPTSAFVRECCERGGPDDMVRRDEIYKVWRIWATEAGHRVTSNSVFGRDLRSVCPEMSSTQPRVGGAQIWFYTGLTLNDTGREFLRSIHNANDPVSPVSDGKTASQGRDD